MADSGDAALTNAQRGLVEENLGLVALHIRRNVRNVGGGRGERDFEDLFQEGCCGLIQAARSFDPARGIPFAAFALPRIHTAVSTALYENASLVRQPRRRARRKSNDPNEEPQTRRDTDDGPPRISTLEIDPPARVLRHDPLALTVGDRIREKYDCAVAVASKRALRRRGTRDDRAALVRLIVDHRLTVAEESQRRALRQIARETGSSYSRVLQCEHRLHEEVRRALAGDLEFRRLREVARRSDEGLETAIDSRLRTELRQLAAEEFWRKLNLRSQRDRDELTRELLDDGCGTGFPTGQDRLESRSHNVDAHGHEAAVKQAIASVPRERADALLAIVGAEDAISGKTRAKARTRPADRNAETAASVRRSSGRCRERVQDRRVE